MNTRRRNQRDPLIAQGRIEIDSANTPKELLRQKPFLHPYECSIVILNGDHHRGLVHEPMPEFFWHGAQIDAQAADDHEQQTPSSELVLASQHAS